MTADEVEMSGSRSLVIDNIGSLITNDPTLGRGPLGILENACVVIVDGAVRHVGPAGEIADERIDADGACVLPGFVDSHTHLVFAGDRAEEFTARMAGQPYDGGGIRTTTEATRNTPTDELDRLVRRRLVEAHQAGTTTIEIKSGYGLNVADEARSVAIARRHTAESTFLGAHLLPTEFAGRSDDYIDLVCTDMLDAAAPNAAWIDAFCETGAFDADQCRAVLEAGRRRRSRAPASRQPTRPRAGRAAGGRVRVCVGRPLHLPHRRRHRRARRRATPWPRSCRRPTSPPASRIPTRDG